MLEIKREGELQVELESAGRSVGRPTCRSVGHRSVGRSVGRLFDVLVLVPNWFRSDPNEFEIGSSSFEIIGSLFRFGWFGF